MLLHCLTGWIPRVESNHTKSASSWRLNLKAQTMLWIMPSPNNVVNYAKPKQCCQLCQDHWGCWTFGKICAYVCHCCSILMYIWSCGSHASSTQAKCFHIKLFDCWFQFVSFGSIKIPSLGKQWFMNSFIVKCKKQIEINFKFGWALFLLSVCTHFDVTDCQLTDKYQSNSSHKKFAG